LKLPVHSHERSQHPMSDGHFLESRGFRFELRAEPMPGGCQPIAVVVRTRADEEETHCRSTQKRSCMGPRPRPRGMQSNRRCAGFMTARATRRRSSKGLQRAAAAPCLDRDRGPRCLPLAAPSRYGRRRPPGGASVSEHAYQPRTTRVKPVRRAGEQRRTARKRTRIRWSRVRPDPHGLIPARRTTPAAGRPAHCASSGEAVTEHPHRVRPSRISGRGTRAAFGMQQE
jgi:hypothetical protein